MRGIHNSINMELMQSISLPEGKSATVLHGRVIYPPDLVGMTVQEVIVFGICQLGQTDGDLRVAIEAEIGETLESCLEKLRRKK